MIRPFPRRTLASLLSDKTSCSAAEMVSSAAFQSLFALSIFSVTATNPGFYRVVILWYKNPEGLDANNAMCDGSKDKHPCEFYFKVTFRVGKKLLKNFTSKVVKPSRHNVIDFNTNSSMQKFVINVSNFQKSVEYHIVVMGRDPEVGGDDEIEVLSGSLPIPNENVWMPYRARRNSTAKSYLQFYIKRKSYPRKASKTSASPTTTSKKDLTTHDYNNGNAPDRSTPKKENTMSTTEFTDRIVSYSQAQSTTTSAQMKASSPSTQMTTEETNFTKSGNGSITAGAKAWQIYIPLGAVVAVVIVAVITATAKLCRRRRPDGQEDCAGATKKEKTEEIVHLELDFLQQDGTGLDNKNIH